LDLTQFLPHLGLSAIALIIPASVALLVYGLMQLWHRLGNYIEKTKSTIQNPKSKIQNLPKPKPFVELAYGYLPLVLGGNLAHYLYLGLGEAGRIIPVTLATFGFSGEQMPVLVAHPAVTAFLQGTTLIFSVLLTVILTQKIARQPLRSLLLQHLGSVVLAISIWMIVVGR
jgi:hypothetical protein